MTFWHMSASVNLVKNLVVLIILLLKVKHTNLQSFYFCISYYRLTILCQSLIKKWVNSSCIQKAKRTSTRWFIFHIPVVKAVIYTPNYFHTFHLFFPWSFSWKQLFWSKWKETTFTSSRPKPWHVTRSKDKRKWGFTHMLIH